MARAFWLVMDSFGIGSTPDADKFGDVGANTFGTIAKTRLADTGQPLKLPNLARIGLAHAAAAATGETPAGFDMSTAPEGRVAACAERSKGKDTPSGHWEMAGVPVLFDWGYFPPASPSFPEPLVSALCEEAGLPGILGNKAASGTDILQELGEQHIRTGMPICYTSADSVFQIAAHEQHFGLERLYDLCEIARDLVDDHNIGRVIARPFIGDTADSFTRTGNRRDYATPPPSATLLDHLSGAGHEVISIGKIADIFAHQGLTHKIKADGNMALFDETLKAADNAADGSLVFTNFVDFDQNFGHRRDIDGYANALEEFDARLPALEEKLRPGDIVVITADHGCDPGWPGSDHTREYVPALFFGPDIIGGTAGIRDSFADMGQTLAQHFGLAPLQAGQTIDLT